MTTIVLLGGQFGDEGKGQDKIPDPELCSLSLMEPERQIV